MHPRTGAYHSFLLTHTENVYACGLNNMGQLGVGSLEPGYTAEPMLVEALEGKGVCQLSGGASTHCNRMQRTATACH